LGGKRLRTELGDEYVDKLFELYDGRVPREADLVCYWFEKARATIENKKAKRAGLLATNSIRGGANRKVLERIKETGDIFWAYSDRDWILEGAAVNVSMIGFDNKIEKEKHLDGTIVNTINPNLTASTDITIAVRLPENKELCFMGITPGGSFAIPDELATKWLSSIQNPNGKSNANVLRKYYNGQDIVSTSRGVWLIDFGDMKMVEASGYELPFEFVRENIKPFRDKNNRASYREKWWLHAESRPAMRNAIKDLPRYIATPRISKHRVFVWIPGNSFVDSATFLFSRDDDYFFGVLHSKLHEIWALKQGTSLEDRPRYTPTSTFETFPFPWAPGGEPGDDPRVKSIAQAAKELVEQRERWLAPTALSGTSPKSDEPQSDLGEAGRGQKRTLTNLYNARPTWLELAHKKLDEAVFAAYGWPSDLSDEEILERLLALNLERAGRG
jgi:type II restriction/modification system DNA methylase subunit YeeA